MSADFEEIDRRPTPIGEISVRRRFDPSFGLDVYEVKLGDEFLMSSLFTVSEVGLARLALAELAGTDLDVVVGGLGLGYTARTVLEDGRVRSLQVVEALEAVIEWHDRHLLPNASDLSGDPRCRLVEGDFFSLIESASPFSPDDPGAWHAIVVDIDHSPRNILAPAHAGFYTADGLRRLAARLHPGGVFALWSDDPPDQEFIDVVGQVFASCTAHVVPFPNPYTGGESACTVYVAKAPVG